MGSEMQERIARAIYEGRNGRGCAPWGRVAGAHKAPYFSDALAAMRAMRDPTEGAVAYGKQECSNVHDIDAEGIEEAWRDMMDYEIKKAEEG